MVSFFRVFFHSDSHDLFPLFSLDEPSGLTSQGVLRDREACVEMMVNGKWNNLKCQEEQRGYICETAKLPPDEAEAMSGGMVAAIVVSVMLFLVVAALLLALAFFLVRKRRRNAPITPSKMDNEEEEDVIDGNL